LHAILHDEPPPLDVDSPASSLAPIVRKLLRKNPADRYASAEAVLQAIVTRSAGPASAVPAADSRPLTAIAVLPFIILSDLEERKAFSLGFADALITSLGGLEDFAVLPTSAILPYAAGADPVRTCGDLGVRYLVQGNVQKIGERWRVSIQLFDGATHKIACSEKHDFIREDVFEIQDEIARRVVETLQSRFTRAAPKSRDRYSSEATPTGSPSSAAPPNTLPGPSNATRNSPWPTRRFPMSRCISTLNSTRNMTGSSAPNNTAAAR
jgi:TolB-like protein